MIRLLAIVLFVAPVAVAAPVPKELKNEGKLEGTWKVESLSTNGQPAGQQGTYWTIDAEGMLTLHSVAKPPAANSRIRFKHDRATKAIDYTQIDGDRNYPGLYELRGDTLKFCFNLKDQDRPKAIGEGQDLNLWTFTRVKPEEKK